LLLLLLLSPSLGVVLAFFGRRLPPVYAEAVGTMLETSGHTVLISGATLCLCFCGMLLVPVSTIATMGVSAAVTVFFGVAFALVLTPTLLLSFPRFFLTSSLRCWLLTASSMTPMTLLPNTSLSPPPRAHIASPIAHRTTAATAPPRCRRNARTHATATATARVRRWRSRRPPLPRPLAELRGALFSHDTLSCGTFSCGSRHGWPGAGDLLHARTMPDHATSPRHHWAPIRPAPRMLFGLATLSYAGTFCYGTLSCGTMFDARAFGDIMHVMPHGDIMHVTHWTRPFRSAVRRPTRAQRH